MYKDRLYAPWVFDAEFMEILTKVKCFTLIGPERLFTLWRLAMYGKLISGIVAEVGVYKGGSLYFLNKAFGSNTEIYGFDTFEGMPDNIDVTKDSHRGGDFKDTNIGVVRNLLGSGTENVKLISGCFPETGKVIEDKKFSLVHIDCDIYRSVLDCCEFFYGRMSKGGIMLFDDYGFWSCRGAKAAVDEFFKDKKGDVVIYLTTGQAMVIKT